VTELPTGTGAIKVTVQRLNGTGTVWVDDVRCEEGVSRKEDKTYYYHCDYLGSPRVMTDPLGNVIWRQDYYAFGGDYNTSATGNTHKFTGHVKDDATGQYYAKARYFTTNNGRWSQPEPLLKGVPGKMFLLNPLLLNPYIYGRNNPLKYIDPSGLFTYLIIVGQDKPNPNVPDKSDMNAKGAFTASAKTLEKEIMGSSKFDKSRDKVVTINAKVKADFVNAINAKYESGSIMQIDVFSHSWQTGANMGGTTDDKARLFKTGDLPGLQPGLASEASMTYHGCNAGKSLGNEASLAQQTADALGIPVTGATGHTMPVTDGSGTHYVPNQGTDPGSSYITYQPTKE